MLTVGRQAGLRVLQRRQRQRGFGKIKAVIALLTGTAKNAYRVWGWIHICILA